MIRRLSHSRFNNSGSAVQAFVETHHLVSESPSRLQDRGNATERGQVQRVPVRRRHHPPQRKVQPLTVPNSRDSVEARGHFTGVNRPPGNENRRWHGTRRKCTLGDIGCTTFCSDPQCSLCCIIKTSFDLAHFGKKTSWGRFGAGIYTSSTSSKFVLRFPPCPSRSFVDGTFRYLGQMITPPPTLPHHGRRCC